jgi:hypothetical protein
VCVLPIAKQFGLAQRISTDFCTSLLLPENC